MMRMMLAEATLSAQEGIGGIESMPEKLHRGTSRALEVVEWRLARPEDGPVWVALTREGRAPLVPREALAEPDQWLKRDQREQRDELARFLTDGTGRREVRFLLWRASRPLGRLCFEVRGDQARLGGMAFLPGVGSEVIEQVARIAVERALEAGAQSVTAAYETRHAKAFAAAGFRERRRYTVMVAATRRAADGEDEMEPIPLNSLYRLRPIQSEDAQALSALLHESYRDEPDSQERPATSWLIDVAQLREGSDNHALGECSFLAELRHGVHTPPKLVGAILVSLWQGAALIDELVVAPRYRQRSVGSALLRRAMLGLREHNYASVMLIVNEDAPTQQFYHRLGFREALPGYVEAEYSLRQTPLDD